MERIRYLSEKGYTEDEKKAVYGAITSRKELKAPRFTVGYDGDGLVWEEHECGLTKVSTRPRRGGNAETPTSDSTRSVRNASKKGKSLQE